MSQLTKDVERGNQAARLLNDPVLCDAFEEVKRAIHEQWASCPLRDREGAHELRLMLKLTNDVWAVLEAALSDGKVAVQELERLNRKVLTPKEWSGR
jgi:hypothetical protein